MLVAPGPFTESTDGRSKSAWAETWRDFDGGMVEVGGRFALSGLMRVAETRTWGSYMDAKKICSLPCSFETPLPSSFEGLLPLRMGLCWCRPAAVG